MTYNDYYLAHHGIKGQKWGVRRYQNDDGTLTDLGRKRYRVIEREERKVESSFTNFGKRRHAIKAEKLKSEFNIANNASNKKGISKLKAKYGLNAKSERAAGLARGYERAQQYTKTERQKTKFNAYSFNAHSLSEYYKQVSNKKGLDYFIETQVFRKDFMKMPIKTVVGRETTIGRQAIDNILYLSPVKDALYKNRMKTLKELE